MVRYFMNRHVHTKTDRPHFFYCLRDEANAGRSISEDILRSILRQMSCLHENGPILRPASRLCKKKKGDSAKPPLQETLQTIIDLAQRRSVTYIVIDALDECDREQRQALISALQHIMANSASLIKVFVSSRYEPDIRSSMEKALHVRISASESLGDMEAFIQHKLEHQIQPAWEPYGLVTPDLVAKVKETLHSGANGM
jgi:hypothetical protein